MCRCLFSCHLVAFQNAAFFCTQVLSDAALSSDECFHTGFLPVASFSFEGMISDCVPFTYSPEALIIIFVMPRIGSCAKKCRQDCDHLVWLLQFEFCNLLQTAGRETVHKRML